MSMADDIEEAVTSPLTIARKLADAQTMPSPILPDKPEFDEEYAILLIRAKDGRFARMRLIRWLKDGTSKTYRIGNPAEALVLLQVNRVAYANRQFAKLEAAEVEAQSGLQS